jgi:hypothetical protein
MRLELHKVKINKLAWGDTTSVRAGVLTEIGRAHV